MNTLRDNFEYHCNNADTFDDIDFDYIEDIHIDFLFGIPGKQGHYETTIDLLAMQVNWFVKFIVILLPKCYTKWIMGLYVYVFFFFN